MVFCDIDGTLVNSKNQISKETKQKIQELYFTDIPFILVSARMPSGIFPLQKELGIEAPIICYSGALILSKYGECLKTVVIGREKAIDIYEFVKKEFNNICQNAFYGNDWIVDDIYNKWVIQEQYITASKPIKGPIFDFVLLKGHVHKFLFMGEAEQICDLNKVLKEKYPELSIYRSKDTYLEIMASDASKSSSVKYICENYNINIENTVSFGDNFNDLDMLLSTGTCFVMGNAPDEVKRQFKNITLNNDNDGVLVGLNKLDFGKN